MEIQATIEEFAGNGYTRMECHYPTCRLVFGIRSDIEGICAAIFEDGVKAACEMNFGQSQAPV
jgi:hypothetical protein